jgi:lipoate-protein ligase B
MSAPEAIAFRLGRVPYLEALALQRRLVRARIAERIPDALLLLEHPPVFSVGRSGGIDGVRVPRERLAAEGIELYYADRGGGITYHGPGQVVGYPIVSLAALGLNVHDYVHGAKVCAIGLRVTRSVTMHGFALNVAPNMTHFDFIDACGLREAPVSLAQLVKQPPAQPQIEDLLVRHFASVFGLAMREEKEEVERWLEAVCPLG